MDEIKIDSDRIIKSLKASFSHPKYLSLSEARIGTGFGKENEQRIDFWAMSSYPSENFLKYSFEVKTSRSDFLREIKNPDKRKWAMRYSNHYIFAAPANMLKPDEIPLECGLWEFCQNEGSALLQIKKTVPSPYRESMRPNWSFIAAVMRREQEIMSNADK